MTSFPAQAARVRDAGQPLRRRLLALRECALHFAPYGFRATWHHLVVSAGLPVRLEDDPDSLLRAVDELDEARCIWLAETRAFEARRRQEKAAGRRQPRRSEGWQRLPGRLAYCPDPERHPRERLATVVERLIAAYRPGVRPLTVCPACGVQRPCPPCPSCGAFPWDPAGGGVFGGRGTGFRWQQIWRRAVSPETTAGGGHVTDFRSPSGT